MEKIYFILIASLCITFCYGQEIRMERMKFYDGNNLLKPKEVLHRMKIDPEAFQEFKKAKSNYDAAQVIGFAGGFMVGWPLGTALAGGDPQWGLAGGGVALILATIPMNIAFKKHAKKALAIYNVHPESRRALNLKMQFYGGGGRLVLKW